MLTPLWRAVACLAFCTGWMSLGCGGGTTAPSPRPPTVIPDPLQLAWWDSVSTDPDYVRPVTELRAEGVTTIFLALGDLTESRHTPRVTVPLPDPPIFYNADDVASGSVKAYATSVVTDPAIKLVPELPVSELYRLQPDLLGRPPVAADFVHLVDFVRALGSDPVVSPRIGGYLLVDEPSHWAKRWVTPDLLAALVVELRKVTSKTFYLNFEITAINATNHPLTGEFLPPLDLPAWKDLADVFMYDEYPYTLSGEPDPVIPLIRFNTIRLAMDPKPTIFWCQGFGESDFPAAPVSGSQGPQQRRKLRHPSGPEARFQAWSALSTGSKGLAWFVLHWIPPDMRRERFGPVTDEVRRLRGLLAAPNLLATLPGIRIDQGPLDCIIGPRTCFPPQYRLSQDPLTGDLLLICLNRSTIDMPLGFTLPLPVGDSLVSRVEIVDPFGETAPAIVSHAGGEVRIDVTLAPYRVGIWKLVP